MTIEFSLELPHWKLSSCCNEKIAQSISQTLFMIQADGVMDSERTGSQGIECNEKWMETLIMQSHKTHLTASERKYQ